MKISVNLLLSLALLSFMSWQLAVSYDSMKQSEAAMLEQRQRFAEQDRPLPSLTMPRLHMEERIKRLREENKRLNNDALRNDGHTIDIVPFDANHWPIHNPWGIVPIPAYVAPDCIDEDEAQQMNLDLIKQAMNPEPGSCYMLSEEIFKTVKKSNREALIRANR